MSSHFQRSPEGRVLAQEDPVSGCRPVGRFEPAWGSSYLFDSPGVVSDSRVYDSFGDEQPKPVVRARRWGSNGNRQSPLTRPK